MHLHSDKSTSEKFDALMSPDSASAPVKEYQRMNRDIQSMLVAHLNGVTKIPHDYDQKIITMLLTMNRECEGCYVLAMDYSSYQRLDVSSDDILPDMYTFATPGLTPHKLLVAAQPELRSAYVEFNKEAKPIELEKLLILSELVKSAVERTHGVTVSWASQIRQYEKGLSILL